MNDDEAEIAAPDSVNEPGNGTNLAASRAPGASLTWRERVTTLATVGVFVVIADQATKIWAVSELTGRDIDLFWTARLHLISNTGSAFGLNAGFGRWLGVIVLGVVVAIVWFSRRVHDRRILLLFGAMIGGAIGNVIDRVLRAERGFMSGGVVDFIDLQWWPIFNVADMAVVLSAFGLALVGMREQDDAR